MSEQIWKFKLELKDIQSIEMPLGAVILSVKTQNDRPFIWALIDPEMKTTSRTFELIGTGNDIYQNMGVDRKFLDTVLILHETAVFHIFERLN